MLLSKCLRPVELKSLLYRPGTTVLFYSRHGRIRTQKEQPYTGLLALCQPLSVLRKIPLLIQARPFRASPNPLVVLALAFVPVFPFEEYLVIGRLQEAVGAPVTVGPSSLAKIGEGEMENCFLILVSAAAVRVRLVGVAWWTLVQWC
jgi:hypothetical protein